MIWWPARPDAVRIDSGWNCTAHRPAAASSMAITTPSAPSGEQSDAVTVEPAADLPGRRVQAVVAPGGELGGQPGQQRSPGHLDQPGLPCAGSGSSDSAPPACSTMACSPRQTPKAGSPRAYTSSSSAAQPKSAGPSRAGREDHQVRCVGVEQCGRESGPQRGHLGALLAEVVAQGVHERVLVVDQQHPQAAAGRTARARGGRTSAPAAIRPASASVSSRARALICVSFSSASGTESIQQRRARPHRRDPAGDVRGAQRQPGIHRAVEADLADGPAVPAARGLLVVLDELHGPGLRRAGHGDRPHVGEERVERVEAGPQPALDVVHGVDEAAVHLDLPPADDPDRARARRPATCRCGPRRCTWSARIPPWPSRAGSRCSRRPPGCPRRGRSCRRSGRSPPGPR